MKFDVTCLHAFLNVKFYRASDTVLGGWNGYGRGSLRVNFINRCDANEFDCRGMGQMTYHNELSKAGGLNMCIVENFVMVLSKTEPRLTFKAASDVFGSNGLKNMYTMKMDSFEDAKRLMGMVHLLERAAKQAQEGNRILLPDPQSIDATTARILIGSDKKEVERHLIFTKLVELAVVAGERELPLVVSNEVAAAASGTLSNAKVTVVENPDDSADEDGDDDSSWYRSDTADEANEEYESTEDEYEPLTPDSARFQESQQWQPSFGIFDE